MNLKVKKIFLLSVAGWAQSEELWVSVVAASQSDGVRLRVMWRGPSVSQLAVAGLNWHDSVVATSQHAPRKHPSYSEYDPI